MFLYKENAKLNKLKHATNYMKFLKKALIFLVVVAILVGLFLFFENVYYPAKLSVKTSCGDFTREELNIQGYYVAGEYFPSSDTIVLYDEDPTVLKHENCHKVQAEKSRLSGCSNRFGLMLNEIECYSTQNLPDRIYYWIY